MMVMEAKSRPSSASLSFAARSMFTLAASLTFALSFTATGGSFCGLMVKFTVATFEVAPLASSIV